MGTQEINFEKSIGGEYYKQLLTTEEQGGQPLLWGHGFKFLLDYQKMDCKTYEAE